jgi:hypothetical protein
VVEQVGIDPVKIARELLYYQTPARRNFRRIDEFSSK